MLGRVRRGVSYPLHLRCECFTRPLYRQVPIEQAVRVYKSAQQALESEVRHVTEVMLRLAAERPADWPTQLATLSSRIEQLKQQVYWQWTGRPDSPP